MEEQWNKKGTLKRKSREIPKMSIDSFYKILALTTNKPFDDVKEIISASEDVLNYLLVKGYQITIPNVGTFRPTLHKGYEKGCRVPIYEKGIGGRLLDNTGVVDTDKKKLVLEDGKYYLEYIKSSSNYVVPKFTFSRRVKDKLKDESIIWEK